MTYTLDQVGKHDIQILYQGAVGHVQLWANGILHVGYDLFEFIKTYFPHSYIYIYIYGSEHISYNQQHAPKIMLCGK